MTKKGNRPDTIVVNDALFETNTAVSSVALYAAGQGFRPAVGYPVCPKIVGRFSKPGNQNKKPTQPS